MRNLNDNRLICRFAKKKLVALILVVQVFATCGFNGKTEKQVTLEREPARSRKSCGKECESKDAHPFFDHEDLELRLKKAGEVSGILEKLGSSREKFLETGDFKELFPTLYFHTTKLEFDKVLGNKTQNPIEKLEMIISFFDAYQFNRELFEKGGPGAVEPHWKTYFEKAVAANESGAVGDKYDKMTELMFDGVDAHVVYDLPRFVRYFTSKKPERVAELKQEYNGIDSVFVEAAQNANGDILKALEALGVKRPGKNGDSMFKSGASYIIVARKNSWDIGVSSQPLLTKGPQPVLKRDSNSRKYFPPDVLKTGICRKVRSKAECPFEGYRRFE